ncbi:MAG: hypothetical protein Ta2D_09680 [Rickettsiales bacterium]|nr:MAG: hypothetical protein Ta2D_09680 [Rickettsiales bacterium]
MQKLMRQMKLYSFLFFLFLTNILFASILQKNKIEMNIKADNVEVFDDNKKAIFTDNVKVKNKEWTMFADKIIVIYNEKDVSEINAFGHIRLFSKNVKAQSEKATYLSTKKLIIMSEKVNAIDNGMNITGDIFTYNIDTKESNVQTKENKRVEIIIDR